MKWQIPAKTFLIGEYIALKGHSALLATTSPYFSFKTTTPGIHGIHKSSPAYLWWHAQHPIDKGIIWFDPYNNIGGMGASSAQFVGAYTAYAELTQAPVCHTAMLEDYYRFTTTTGQKPSGYDLIAQTQGCGLVYINRQQGEVNHFNWPFLDITCILIHTGKKLATHEHLKNLPPLTSTQELISIADDAVIACNNKDSARFIRAINNYYIQLQSQSLIANYTKEIIQQLQITCRPLAIKGCGAMGADIILLIVKNRDFDNTLATLQTLNFLIVGQI